MLRARSPVVALLYTAALSLPVQAAHWPAVPCAPAPGEATPASALDGDSATQTLVVAARPGATTGEALLLQAEAAALLLDDARAVRLAQEYLAGSAPARATDAQMLIGAVELRRGEYAAAARAFDAARAGAGQESMPAARTTALANSLAIARALAGQPAPTGPSGRQGTIALTRDAASLTRTRAMLNGGSQEVVLDTGANLSVIVESRARALGLRILEDPVSVASPISPSTPARLAVAEQVSLGAVRFSHVVFLVLPDAALRFADGAYTIEAIIGFPVLRRLGQLHFAARGKAETLRFIADDAPERGLAPVVNLVVDGSTPKLLACAGDPRRPLQMALDTGAQETSLRPRFATDFPALVGTTAERKERVGGAGGTVEQAVRVIPDLTFDVADQTVTLRALSLSPETLDHPGDHARLGQDALFNGYTLDFQRMRMTLAPGR